MTHAAWLLLIPAAGGRWLAGRAPRRRDQGRRAQCRRLSNTYFRGLNYLLNEQQDKAIEIFLQIAEVDKDTVETQFALGHLFRRRGEVDRAIRLHQNLVARTGLSEEQKTRAVLALGEDYMRAGLLDRAETLFTDLVADGRACAAGAAPADLDLPGRARLGQGDRTRAAATSRRRGEPMGKLIAQFQCELAEQARSRRTTSTLARDAIADGVLGRQPTACVPASSKAGMELAEGNDAGGDPRLRARRPPRHRLSCRRSCRRCWPATRNAARARARAASCTEMIEHYPGVSPVLALAQHDRARGRRRRGRRHSWPASCSSVRRCAAKRP